MLGDHLAVGQELRDGQKTDQADQQPRAGDPPTPQQPGTHSDPNHDPRSRCPCGRIERCLGKRKGSGTIIRLQHRRHEHEHQVMAEHDKSECRLRCQPAAFDPTLPAAQELRLVEETDPTDEQQGHGKQQSRGPVP